MSELDLNKLIAGMNPVLYPEEMVFCCVTEEQRKKAPAHPLCIFQEREGITLILTRRQAESAALSFSYVCRMITLTVHSSLDAIGFLATIAGLLAKHGISVNVVSAYYHDHLFVPAGRATDALRILRELQTRSAVGTGI